MQLPEWITKILSWRPKRRIDPTKEMISLNERSERLHEDIEILEKRRKELVQIGRDAESKQTKIRLSRQIARIDKDTNRLNVSIAIINRQIDILSGVQYHRQIVNDIKDSLPTSDEITQATVEAEEAIERLEEIGNVPEAGYTDSTTDEEMAILKELGYEEPSTSVTQTHESITNDPVPTQTERTKATA